MAPADQLSVAPRFGAIPDLDFAVEDAAPVRHAAAPTVRLTLRVRSADERRIHALLLDIQLRIAARRRSYASAEEERLAELFGPVGNWKTSLSSFLWTQTTLFVPGFTGATTVDLPVACTYDFEVAAAKYLDALQGGEAPVELLFSGTVFHAGEHGEQRVVRLPLDREARFRLPVSVWRETMDACFPGSAWLRLERDSFDRLAAHRARGGHPTWEAAVASLLDAEER